MQACAPAIASASMRVASTASSSHREARLRAAGRRTNRGEPMVPLRYLPLLNTERGYKTPDMPPSTLMQVPVT